MAVMKTIYLDNAATTPMDPQVLDAMLPFFKERFGNPASRTHSFGASVEAAVHSARQQVARLIGAQSDEIIWTSGATEANNLALIGTARKYRQRGNHIITCQTEHKAVLDPCVYLEQTGFNVTYLPVDQEGMIDLDQLKNSITDQTILISFMAVNNETGLCHPLAEIGQIARSAGVFFHCDGSQAAGKMPLDVREMKIDLLSINAHKLYGPKGIGCLYVSAREPTVRPEPLIHGGGHEKQFRSGTLNVPGLIGLAKACEIAMENMDDESKRLKTLADNFEKNIQDQLPDVKRNGHPIHSLPHIRNLSFAGLDSETLMLAMPDLAVSSGAACTNTNVEPSYVLKAMQLDNDRARAALRFSLGRFTTESEIETAINIVTTAVKKLRRL